MADLTGIDPVLTEHGTEVFRYTAQKSFESLIAPGSPAGAQLHQVIQANGINTTPEVFEEWLSSNPVQIKTNDRMRAVDEVILKDLAANNRAMVAKSRNVEGAKPLNPARYRTLHVCRLTVLGPNGQVKSRGSGFFLTDTLLLTCHHVLGEGPLDGKIQVDVPYRHENKNRVSVSAAVRFYAKQSLGKPLLHAQCPSLDLAMEVGPFPDEAGPLVDPDASRLDYCVLEIEESPQHWTLRADAERDDLSAYNVNHVMHEVSNQFPDMRKPATAYMADELVGRPVSIHTLTEALALDSRNGGSVLECSNQRQRVRYGDAGIGLTYGDSGCPLTNADKEIVGIHNAEAGNRGQAVPIGAIIGDIRRQAPAIMREIFPDFP